MMIKRKIVNDPIYGFITIPDELAYTLIEHPWFQRLRRISQLGLTSMVYPGALHTRFHHALGTMHLMSQAIDTLRSKGVEISTDEARGATLAILLHDIGHGPFSHALEYCIVKNISHETISTLFINRLNKELNHSLDLARAIFMNEYPVKFLHQLVSGQLDMDRMDYLMRDSFYTGVSEGVINTERILKMLTISGDDLAIELKGIYSIEKFIVARRLMYWQVYYHKTVLAAEYMLVNILRRAKLLAENHKLPQTTPAFTYFLSRTVTLEEFMEDGISLETFALLDDFDIMTSIKSWTNSEDPVLSILCNALLNRRLFRVIIAESPFPEEYIQDISHRIKKHSGLGEEECAYLLTVGTISNNAYDPLNDRINIVDKNGNTSDFSELSDQLNIAMYSRVIRKHFISFPKWAEQM